MLGVPPPGASEEGDEANVEAEYFLRNNNNNNNNNNNIRARTGKNINWFWRRNNW